MLGSRPISFDLGNQPLLLGLLHHESAGILLRLGPQIMNRLVLLYLLYPSGFALAHRLRLFPRASPSLIGYANMKVEALPVSWQASLGYGFTFLLGPAGLSGPAALCTRGCASHVDIIGGCGGKAKL